MSKFSARCFILGSVIAIMACALDQASKLLLISPQLAQQPIEVSSFFNLVMVWNHGVSFGMFAEHDQRVALIAMTGLLSLALVVWLARTPSKLIASALGLIIGGAVGNIIDRVRLGAVADFFDFHLFERHWPAFNIADSFIFIGVVVLCIHSMFMDDHSKDTD